MQPTIAIKNILVAAIILTTPTLAVEAQTPPADTYKPGFWQPAARIDAKIPITIEIINITSIAIDYGFTEDREEELVKIPVGETIKIERITLPSYLSITPHSSNPDSAQFDLKYEVTANNNKVTVTVRQVGENDVGNGTIDIQETGGIYVY